ncbi:MAG: RNA polymerase sigma-70 factor [Bacteroidota bacterium]
MDLITRSVSVLFSLIPAGDAAAFDELFLNYYPRLIAFARQYAKQQEAAEEIASDVLMKLWLKRAALNQVNKPEVYLYVSVKNAALNYLRSVKNQPSLVLDEPEVIEPASSTHPDQKELQSILQQAIAALPEQRRLIFKMIKEDGLKCRDVAEILDLSTRTVESQLYKAVKFLADRLSAYLGYNPQRPAKRKSLLLNVLMYCW